MAKEKLSPKRGKGGTGRSSRAHQRRKARSLMLQRLGELRTTARPCTTLTLELGSTFSGIDSVPNLLSKIRIPNLGTKRQKAMVAEDGVG